MKNKIGKKIVTFICAIVLLSTSSNYTQAKNVYSGIAYDITNFETISDLSEISVQKEKSSVEIKFRFNNNYYDIIANQFKSDGDQHMYNYYDDSLKINYNIVYYKGSISGSVTRKDMSVIQQKEDQVNNFCFIISQANNNELKSALNESATEKADLIKKMDYNIEASTDQLQSSLNLNQAMTLASTTNNLHVLVSGLSIPFILSGGVSEGWATSSYLYADYYNVSNLSYSIAYNWPSDGVSLWYDYYNSSSAYQSPAWPGAGLTQVPGAWRIDRSIGRIEACTTASFVFKGFPIMQEFYDVQPIG